MRRLFPVALFLGVFVGAPARGSAQNAGGAWIQIQEPKEWSGAGTRGIVVQQRKTLRITGLAQHPLGIREILINGERAAFGPHSNGGVRFTGYADGNPNTGDLEIAVFGNGGEPLIKNYRMTVTQTEPAVVSSAEAALNSKGFRGQRWAVVVGVSDYKDSRIAPLNYADDDAKAFYDFLLSERAGLGGFARENVKLLLNEQATFTNLRTALFTFLQQATPEDVVVIYIAGHGTPNPTRLSDLYLLTYDADIENLPGTAFPMEDVHAAVRRTYARDKIVITDACHSAGVGGQMAFRNNIQMNHVNQLFLEQMQSSSGALAVLTASEVNQYSQEDARWGGGHGVFTHYLMEGLSGRADEDGDRIVTLGEVIEYTKDKVRRETLNAQVPSISQTSFDRNWPMSVVLAPPAQVVAVNPAPAIPMQQAQAAPAKQESAPKQGAAVSPPSNHAISAPANGAPNPAAIEPSASADRVQNAAGPVPPQKQEPVKAQASTAIPQLPVPFSPGSLAFQSLIVPGLGQFRTGRPAIGAVLLAGAVGSAAWGMLSTSETVICAAIANGGACPDIIKTEVSKPYMMHGIGGWVALGLLGAIDSYATAQRGNRAFLESRTARSSVRVAPPKLAVSTSGDVTVEMFRLTF